MTPEALERGNAIISEVNKLENRLEACRAKKEYMKNNNIQPRLSFGHGGAHTVILSGKQDSDMIYMICMMAESSIKDRITELQEEFEAL